MADTDQQTPAQNTAVATEDNPTTSPVDETQTPEPSLETEAQPESTPTEPTTDDTAETPAPEEPKKPSRAERRIKQLTDRVREATQQPLPGGQPQQSAPQFPQYEDGQTVSPQQLQQDLVQTADAIASVRVTEQLAQHDARRNFEQDTTSVPSKFEELNPNSDTYTPELDEAIAQEFQQRAFKVVGYDQMGQPITQLDPSVRLSDIAERQITAARAYAERRSAQVNTAVAQTADATAPRPGGEPPAESKFEDLSIEDMEKRLGFGPQR